MKLLNWFKKKKKVEYFEYDPKQCLGQQFYKNYMFVCGPGPSPDIENLGKYDWGEELQEERLEKLKGL